MNDVLSFSLEKQCELVRNGNISSLALVETYIRHIQSTNQNLNIVIRDNFAGARERASRLDMELKTTGKTVGPLHGVPFTIKDAFRIKNFSPSYGYPFMKLIPSFDNCTIVDRLISAGGIFLGQTNVPLSCFDWQTDSPIYGLTKNPLNPDYTVGGSSGGSAASVAAHYSPFEVGSDVAGSIRYPAHCCGVFGLRPSHGFVPFDDVGPNIHKDSLTNLAVSGPIARNIGDLSLVLSILTQSAPVADQKQKLKLAYSFGWSGISVDADSKVIIENFLSKLRVAGHDVSEFTPNLDFDRCEKVYGTILGYEYKRLIPWPFRLRPFIDIFNYFFNTRRFHSGVFKDSFEAGLLANRTDYADALESAKLLRREFENQLSAFDIWLTPVSAASAIRHQKTGTEQMLNGRSVPYATYLGHYLTWTALMHHPILSAPIGFDKSGMPIGIQLHGKSKLDWQLLNDSSKVLQT